MVWYGDWAKRIELNIDSFWIDEDLVYYPLLISLTSAAGQTNEDLTDVFTELTDSVTLDNTWNPSDKGTEIVLSNGNLTATKTNSTGWGDAAVRSIASRSTGKWYWEVTLDVAAGANTMIGIGTEDELLRYPGDTGEGYGYYGPDGRAYHSSSIAYGNAYTAGDIISVALDLDNGKIYWAKNGVWQNSGDPVTETNPAYTGLAGKFYAMIGMYEIGNQATANFGDPTITGSNFSYTVPTGFTAGFVEPTFVDNTKKIIVTNSEGTPCYTEIEHWDWENEEAWLWTKVSGVVSSSQDTTLYIYYDVTKPDNISYVGDTGDAAAKNVWDSNFKAVWHLSQNPDGAQSVLDSTGNLNHGTPINMEWADMVDGQIAHAYNFDGSNEYVDCGLNASLQFQNAISLEALIKHDGTLDGSSLDTIVSSLGSYTGAAMFLDGRTNPDSQTAPPQHIHFQIGDGGWNTTNVNAVVPSDQWVYIMCTRSGGEDAVVYYDGVSQNLTSVSWDGDVTYVNNWQIARDPSTGARYYGGPYDEIRISDVKRSASYTKANYYNFFDTLVIYESPEDGMGYKFVGKTYEEGSPVSRTVLAYRRDTGEFMGSDISDVNGDYYITTRYEGSHFLVCTDAAGGLNYNDLILGDVYPTTISG